MFPRILCLTKSSSQYKFAPLQGANPDSRCGEPDHDEPPDCQAEGQPDGHGVDHYAEVDVEQEEDGPAHGELKNKHGENKNQYYLFAPTVC